jgi:hypothetical protein
MSRKRNHFGPWPYDVTIINGRGARIDWPEGSPPPGTKVKDCFGNPEQVEGVGIAGLITTINDDGFESASWPQDLTFIESAQRQKEN